MRSGREVWMLSDSAKAKLLDYDYPGNVRELENIIMSGISMTEGEHVLDGKHLDIAENKGSSRVSLDKTMKSGLVGYLESVERQMILDAMSSHGGNITRAAGQLGIKRQTLQHKLRKMDLSNIK